MFENIALPLPQQKVDDEEVRRRDQTEAMTLGDRVALRRKGLLQQVASPRELYEQRSTLRGGVHSDQLRTQAIVSIDAASRLREGREAEYWIGTRKVHCFDPESDDNLTRDAKAGAELTRQVIEDRQADQRVASTSGSRRPAPTLRKDSDMGQAGTAPWWRNAVIYQIYVRSFADRDGDGVGDLPGICARLPYVRDLGVDAVWLNPFYPSPQADAGYDVRDYRDVDPLFGTLADFDALLARAHDVGLRVIVDLVPNHTSSQHPWFAEALHSAPGSPERTRYLFREGRGPGGSQPPNDWQSNFGGPAWTRVMDADGTPGQWYLHLFAAEQPDLDWTNLEVQAEFESILGFWFDRGVDGFRIDVAHGLAKDPEMPDLGGRHDTGGPAAEGHPHWDQDEVHEVYRAWRRIADSYPGDRTFVGEVWVQSPERLALYLRADELHTAFNFGLLLAPWEAGEMRDVIDENLSAMGRVGAPPTWVLSNHDVTRHVTRYGGGEVGTRRARAAAMLMLSLPGGAYVYQGEELGLPDVTDLPDDLRQDPTFARTGGADIGRDGCRVPIPWSGSSPPFGFSPSGKAWLPPPDDWSTRTVEHQQADPSSMLALYRTALRLRREHLGAAAEELAWIEADGPVLAFRRPGTGLTTVVNLGDAPVAPPKALAAGARVLLSSAPDTGDGRIPPDTAVWFTD